MKQKLMRSPKRVWRDSGEGRKDRRKTKSRKRSRKRYVKDLGPRRAVSTKTTKWDGSLEGTCLQSRWIRKTRPRGAKGAPGHDKLARRHGAELGGILAIAMTGSALLMQKNGSKQRCSNDQPLAQGGLRGRDYWIRK